MAFFIFQKNQNNVDGSLYRISETESDLKNLNIIESDYKIIEDNSISFENFKKNIKTALKYNNNTIEFIDLNIEYSKKEELIKYVDNLKEYIKLFLQNNINHPYYVQWNNYLNQLNLLNPNTITYPLNKSLEQYFSDLGQPSYNILQLP